MARPIFNLFVIVCALIGGAPAFGGQAPVKRSSVSGQSAGHGPGAGGEVVVERTGGYAGVYEKYEIFLDGLLLSPRGATRKLAPGMVAEFVDGIRQAGAFADSGVLRRWGLCSDCFSYRVTVRAGGAVKVYQLTEPMKATSAAEEKVLSSIRQFLASLVVSARHP